MRIKLYLLSFELILIIKLNIKFFIRSFYLYIQIRNNYRLLYSLCFSSFKTKKKLWFLTKTLILKLKIDQSYI